VEASHQAGGRVRTWQGPGGLAVDTGAQWIENEGADGRVNPIYALTQQLGIATVPNKCGLTLLPVRRRCAAAVQVLPSTCQAEQLSSLVNSTRIDRPRRQRADGPSSVHNLRGGARSALKLQS